MQIEIVFMYRQSNGYVYLKDGVEVLYPKKIGSGPSGSIFQVTKTDSGISWSNPLLPVGVYPNLTKVSEWKFKHDINQASLKIANRKVLSVLSSVDDYKFYYKSLSSVAKQHALSQLINYLNT